MAGDAAIPSGTTVPRGLNLAKISWPLVAARDLFDLRYGRALVQASRRPGTVPVYGTNGQCGVHDTVLFKGPGVVLGRKGQGPLGVEWVPDDFWVIDTGYALDLRSPDVDLNYAYYVIRFMGLNHLKDGTSNPTLSREVFGAQAIPLPPIGEQRAIAHILGTLDDKIELNRKMAETLEAMARALFTSWFVDFDPVRAKAEGRDTGLPRHIADLFPDSFEQSEIGEVPKGWHSASLPELIEVNPKCALRKGDVAPYLDMANMPTRGHSPDRVVGRPFGSGMRFMNGDTLVARITPCLENGKTAFVDFLEDAQVGWGSTEFIVLRPTPPIPAEFGYCLARSPEFRDFAIQSMTGSSGRQRVPARSLDHFRLATPADEVSIAFGRAVRPLFARASRGVRESRALAALRDALLPKLVSGELRVREAGLVEPGALS